MKRTYLALAGLALAGATIPGSVSPLAQAAGLFRSQPLENDRFAVLARPLGKDSWNLVVLEQVKPSPLCWKQRDDGLVDPALNRFNFTGICNRFLDSNGYSLRVAGDDLAPRYRLRMTAVGGEVQLQATSPEDPTVLVVGRGTITSRDRDGFVPLTLEEGWDLQRRVYGERSLNHIYFAHGSSLSQLIAEAGGRAAPAAEGPGAPSALQTALQIDPMAPAKPSSEALLRSRSVRTGDSVDSRDSEDAATAPEVRQPVVAVVSRSSEGSRVAVATDMTRSLGSSRTIAGLRSGQAVPIPVIPFRE